GLAETVADIAQVAQGAGQVALLDLGVELFLLAAADRLDEVAEVVLATVEGLDDGPVIGERGAAGITRADQVALAAVEDVADEVVALLALEVLVGSVRRQAADLEDQLAVAVVEDTHLGVGRLAVIDVAEPAAEAEDCLRQFVLAQAPAGLVHLVDALVAQVAVAGVPDPVPVVMEVLAHQRQLLRRAAPQVVVARLGDRLLAIDLADGGAPLVARALRDADFADLAGMEEGHRLAHACAGAALRAALDDLVMLPRRRDQLPAFPDVVADRLLAVNA